jgi:hypothetical protein
LCAAIIRVTDLREAAAALRQALAASREVLLVSESAVTAFAGVGFWRALEQALDHPIVIDCGDDAGLAMAALRSGCRDLLFTGPEEVANRLHGMAAQLDAKLRRRLEQP